MTIRSGINRSAHFSLIRPANPAPQTRRRLHVRPSDAGGAFRGAVRRARNDAEERPFVRRTPVRVNRQHIVPESNPAIFDQLEAIEPTFTQRKLRKTRALTP